MPGKPPFALDHASIARPVGRGEKDPSPREAEGRRQVGARIRELRKDKLWTLRQFGEHSGCSLGYLSEVENGGRLPSLERLDSLATALGVTVAELLEPTWPFGSGQRAD